MVAAVLGVVASGGAYVPLDPWQPRERLALIVEAAGLAVMVTQASLVGELPEHGARVVLMESVERPANAVDASRLAAAAGEGGGEPRSSGESLAYVIFTSGSTGRPKGVQVTHRALASFLMSMRRSPGLAAGDALLAVTTLSFDIAGLELLLPLVVGARVEVASREELADGVALSRRLSRCGATVMQATPAHWQLLVDAGWEGDVRLRALRGEALPVELAAWLLPRVATLWNLYGPTETTIWSAARQVSGAEVASGAVWVGGPIANTRLLVLDRGWSWRRWGWPESCGSVARAWRGDIWARRS